MFNVNTKDERKAVLALEDGTVFFGQSCGYAKTVSGEVVFNTSPTGYQEICTDPSYDGQIVVFTSPHIGNTGVNGQDNESERIWVKGIIVLEMSKMSSSWRSEKDFMAFLNENQIPWIEGVDTRQLVRRLSERGGQRGCIMTGGIDKDAAIELAKTHVNAMSVSLSSSTAVSRFNSFPEKTRKNIVVYDFGVKTSILMKLSNLGCSIKVIPSSHMAEDILSCRPDGVVISNGPGDPAQMEHGIRETKKLIASGLPIFGICLGCQLIALASGGHTKKLSFGHHGTNHPVYDLNKKKVCITSQNHHFAIDEINFPAAGSVTHHSLFDGSIQGIRLRGRPVFGFQGHPEGAPGPEEMGGLFEEFLKSV